MPRVDRWLVDRAILATLAVVSLAVLSGLLAFTTQGAPTDPLHLLYGAVALIALPVARYVARSGTQRRRSMILVVGALVLAGVLLRSFMTGSQV